MNRTYDRTWEEIEDMLDKAERTKNNWQCSFEAAKKRNDREPHERCCSKLQSAGRGCQDLALDPWRTRD